MPALCPALTETASCTRADCGYSHDLRYFCFVCNLALHLPHDDPLHLRTKSHIDALDFKRTEPFCSLCNVIVTAQVWPTHVLSKAHKRQVTSQGQTPSSPVLRQVVPEGRNAACHTCSRWFIGKAARKQHKLSRKHQDRAKVELLKRPITAALTTAGGILVSHPDGVVDFSHSEGSSSVAVASITVTPSAAGVELVQAVLHSSITYVHDQL